MDKATRQKQSKLNHPLSLSHGTTMVSGYTESPIVFDGLDVRIRVNMFAFAAVGKVGSNRYPNMKLQLMNASGIGNPSVTALDGPIIPTTD